MKLLITDKSVESKFNLHLITGSSLKSFIDNTLFLTSAASTSNIKLLYFWSLGQSYFPVVYLIKIKHRKALLDVYPLLEEGITCPAATQILDQTSQKHYPLSYQTSVCAGQVIFSVRNKD